MAVKNSNSKGSKTSKVVKETKEVATTKIPKELGKSQKTTVEYFCSTFDPSTITREDAATKFCNEMGPYIVPYFPAKSTEKDLRGMFNYYCTYDKESFKAPEVTLSELERPMLSEPVPYEAKKIDLHNVDKDLFVPLKTGTAFDLIASKRGGLMKGTVYILTGESGCGKTTIATNIGDYLQEVDPTITVGFISGEMDETDWTEECFDNPRLAEIPTVFLLNYLDAPNYMEVLMKGLTDFKYCILDSFEVVIDQLKDRFGWTAKKAETELLNMLRQAASKGVTIICIQQYTKGGTFVGSNKIKHLLTGMMFVMFDKDGDRYLIFTKNRRGGHMVKKKLYYTKNTTTGRLEFDAQRFQAEQAMLSVKRAENEEKLKEAGLLDDDLLSRAAELTAKRNESMLVSRTDHGSGSAIPQHTVDALHTQSSVPVGNSQEEEEEEEA